MGLLFLSGVWWEGGGRLGPGVRSWDPGWEAGPRRLLGGWNQCWEAKLLWGGLHHQNVRKSYQ